MNGMPAPAAVSAGGDELEFTGAVNAVVEGHGEESILRIAWRRKRTSLREIADFKEPKSAPAGDH